VLLTTYIDSAEFQEFIDKEPFFMNESVLKSKLPSKTEFMIRNLFMRGDLQFREYLNSDNYSTDDILFKQVLFSYMNPQLNFHNFLT
jgi:hypothetical protein